MIQTETFVVESEGLHLRGVIHLPEKRPVPCVICSHGLFSSKDSPKFIAIAEHLSAVGFVAIRYDHRGCNESEGDVEDTTVSGRLKDLDSVIRFSRRHPACKERIGLLGSSMGGYISLFAAARNPDLKPLVIWATPHQLRGKKGDFKEEGYPLLKDGFYEDLKQHDLAAVLPKISHCLILHGQDDELVPIWHANKNYENLAEPKKIEVFPSGDHRFTNQGHRSKAIELTSQWFMTHNQ
jgi:alpha-beta hydrolase superfamily lysophospholipase